jgi:hypothetical protein
MVKMLFELKPCNECSHTCVEGQINVKCPFDEIVEDLIKEINNKNGEIRE